MLIISSFSSSGALVFWRAFQTTLPGCRISFRFASALAARWRACFLALLSFRHSSNDWKLSDQRFERVEPVPWAFACSFLSESMGPNVAVVMPSAN